MATAASSSPSTSSLLSTRCFSTPRVSSFRSRQLNANRLSFPSISFSRRANLKVRSNAPLQFKILCALESRATEITEDSWEKSVLKSDTPVLVEFYASWCGPCRMVHRIIDEIAGEYAGKLKCFVLNTDKDSPIAEDYEIKAVPVVLLFKNGEKRESVVGTMPKDFYISAIKRVLES